MKALITYIIEKLKTDVQQWFKQVYDTQQKLIKDNKVEPIDVDVNKLNKPKQSFTFEDFSTDAIVKQIVGNKLVGFTVINQMIRNPKQYILDENKEINLNVNNNTIFTIIIEPPPLI